MARYPAIVKEYIPERHSARVDILGFTQGDSSYPEAEIEYSIGDKFNHTEVLVKAGDYVWVDFINNDIRYPIITGYRNPQVGNATGWRRFEHENIDMAAQNEFILSGSKLTLNFQSIEANGVTVFNDEVTTSEMLHAASGVDNGAGGQVSMVGGMNIHGLVTVNGGDVIADGHSLKSKD